MLLTVRIGLSLMTPTGYFFWDFDPFIFKQTAFMCPFFWQNRQVALMNLHSFALCPVLPHCGQTPFANHEDGVPLHFADTCFGFTLYIGVFESVVPELCMVSLAAFVASFVSLANSTALVNVSSLSLIMKSALSTASLPIEQMNLQGQI